MFEFFDEERRGFVTRHQLAAVMRMLGRSPDEDDLQVMITELDVNGEWKEA